MFTVVIPTSITAANISASDEPNSGISDPTISTSSVLASNGIVKMMSFALGLAV